MISMGVTTYQSLQPVILQEERIHNSVLKQAEWALISQLAESERRISRQLTAVKHWWW
jgi:hypothetical protein